MIARRTRHAAFGMLTAAAVLSAPMLAQEVTGSISGTITDPSGASIKGASVVLTNTDRKQDIRTVPTSGAGFFSASSLPLGVYTVTVTAPGFQTESVTGLVLHVDDRLTVNRQMHIGSSSETVTVAADALRVNLEDAAVSGLINGTQMRELVLSTRNYEQLLSLQPGVAYSGTTDQIYLGPTNPLGGANTVAFSVNGQRTSANNWTIDGADNVDRGSNLTLLAFPSVDAISEFKTLRGTYSAEYGRSASGQINVVTRSGTNDLHGGAYEFFRNDVLNANSWANKNNLPTAIPKRPPLRYNDFGYTIGGPVYIPHIYNGRNKTFFFVSQEFRRVITYSNILDTVPTANERNGLFPVAVCQNFVGAATRCADAGVTQITRFSPTAQAYLKDIFANVPLPNPNGQQDEHTYNYNARNIYNDTQEVVRVDQALGQKVQLFYRLVHDSIPTQEPLGYGSGTSNGLPGVQTTNTMSPATQQLGHVTVAINPTLLVDAGYAYSYGAIISRPAGAALLQNSPDIKVNLPFTNVLGVIPGLTFSGYTGISNAGIYNDFNRNHNIFGNVTKVLGTHTLIVGSTYDRYQKTENATGGNAGAFNVTSNATQLPTLTQANTNPSATPGSTLAKEAATYYQSFANFLTGTATAGFSQSPVPRIPDLRANTYEVYVQDNWKVRPRLTLNLGARYSYYQQPGDNNRLLSNFLPSAYVAGNAPTIDSTGGICVNAPCAGGGTPNPNYDPLNGLIYVSGNPNATGTHLSPFGSRVGQPDQKNLAPRVGFAFDVFGDGRTAFRGGYGIAYDASLFGDYEQNAFNNPPLPVSASFSYTSLDNPAGGSATAAALPSPLSPYSTAASFHSPYSQQYSLDLQQQLSPTLTLDLGYVGSHDTHLLGYVDINEPVPGAARAAGILTAGGYTTAAGVKLANQVRPYRGYAGMYSIQTIFNSNYNSLQLAVKKRFKGRSLIDGNFTWQKFLTNSPADRSGAPQDRTNLNAEYGRSVLDRTTYATIDFVYDLPFFHQQHGLVGRVLGGWEVSGIVALNSGLPSTVAATYGQTINGVTFADVAGLAISGASPAGLRPDQVANANEGTGIRTKLKWLNTAAFASPSAALGRPGNARRGTIILPGFNREDIGLFRNFRIFRESEFQLRGEAFNVLNHTNYSTVNVTATSTTFGQVTGAREARILQIGGKLSF